MKRKVLATVLGSAGLIGMAVSSFGQGQVFFDNYNSTPYATFPVKYGPGTGGLQGTLAGSNVSAELGYFLGTTTNPAQMTLIPSSIVAINAATPGYFEGAIATIPGYSAGPVSFEILAFSADGLFSDAAAPTIWTEASIPATPSPAGFFSSLAAPTILLPVPEPTTLALAGLGGLASLVAFRRKQA
jgi:PEP-CTERM motif